jgi:flagellar M-ring protein FliF
VDSFFETLKNLGPGRLAVMLLTFFGLIIFFIFIAVRSSAPSLTLLYGDLSTSDSTEIAGKLDLARITYDLSSDGKQISVPYKDVGKSRMLLAADGLPRRGSVGYELFDQKQSFGTTSFQQNINQLRALEGELSRTIGTIDQVRSARVHLVLPQRELFSREQQTATASVFLTLRSASLGKEQIQAIQHLVAASVPQLKSANVAIIDQGGNLLARGEENKDSAAAASNGDELKQQFEMRMSRSLEDLVGRVVGYGKVRANVTANLNFDVLSRNSESYNPDGQVVRSTQTVTEESSDSTGGGGNNGVTVENNLPGITAPQGAGGGSGGSSNNRTEETTNYEITKTVESLVRESGEVQRLSIAVLLDGRYETDTAAKKPDDVKEEEWVAPKKYVPRDQAELDQIATLVKSAVGFDDSRGDTVQVINMQFAESDFVDRPVDDGSLIFGFPKTEILGVAETVALSIVAVLVILLVLRPLAMHLATASRRTAEAGTTAQEETALLAAQMQQAQLAGPSNSSSATQSEIDSMIDMGSVEGKVKASSVQKISELVTNHPNETVSVIRQWMSQES